MSAFFSAFLLVLRRSLANWKLLSSIVVGVLVAVTLVSSTPLFSNALSDLGLLHALNKQQIELLDLNMYSPSNPPEFNEYTEMWSFLDQQIEQNIGFLIHQKERTIQGPTFSIAIPDKVIDVSPTRPTGYFQVYSNLEQHVRLTDGRFPDPQGHIIRVEELQQTQTPPIGLSLEELQQAQTLPVGILPENIITPDFEIEALIGTETARNFGVKPGDKFIFYTDLWGDGPTQLTIRLTGLVEPLDTVEEYWQLKTDVFTVESDSGLIAPLFVREDTFFDVIGTVFPQGRATYHWYYFVDISRITSLNAGYITDSLELMERNIVTKLPRATFFTSMRGVIKEFQEKQLYTQIPLFLLVFQVVGIILYYVVTVANMVIEQEATEIALLRSRGANTTQVFGILLMEGVIISAVGGVAGPILGAFVFGLLGKTAPFRPLSGGELLPVRFSDMVFILAAVAAVLCLLAFMGPAAAAARRGIVQQRQQLARPPRAPFWQRFYLDIVLLVIGVGLYYELRQRGTLVQQNIFGDLGIDPLLLITPLLFMIAVAIVFLRVFPLLVFVAEKISKYVANSSIIISLRYMARNPIHYSRLILLLMLAASVGMFSASFLGTLDRSYFERAMYSVGADVRLEQLRDYSAGKKTIYDRYAAVPGIEAVSIVSRGSAMVGTTFTQVDTTVVAMDPESMKQIAWFREDFADKSLPELMDILAKDKPVAEGLTLPEGSEAIGIWTRAAYKQAARIRLFVRIEDGKNQYWDFEMGVPASESWENFEVALIRPYSEDPLPSPLTLHTLFLGVSGGRTGELQGLYLDDLYVKQTGITEPLIIENFDEVADWEPQIDDQGGRSLTGGSQIRDGWRKDPIIFHTGDFSGRYTWTARGGTTYRGIFPNMNVLPIVAIVSQPFLEQTGAQVGTWVNVRMPGQYIPVEIVDTVRYFPTLDPGQKIFMLVNLDRLMTIRNRQLGTSIPIYPNEAWLSVTEDETERPKVIELLKTPDYKAERMHDKNKILAEQKSDPLIAAGWGGVLTLAFFGVALVSGLGFVVYAYLSARGRQLEFAILRTLGFSFRQIITLIGFEQIFIIAVGMGIGTFVGMQLSGVMMPFLQLTERGERVLPPFVFVTDWATIGITYTILGIAFVVTLSLVVLFFTRVALSRTLRMGDQ
jgi:ABC-type lipoprotein release transport system permease subunit